MNSLKAVFWDYPEFTEEKKLSDCLKNNALRQWAMRRFLENGRVVDTLKYFSIKEISENMSTLKLTSAAKEKWGRLVEVYGKH